jgi:hypothetical protein
MLILRNSTPTVSFLKEPNLPLPTQPEPPSVSAGGTLFFCFYYFAGLLG